MHRYVRNYYYYHLHYYHHKHHYYFHHHHHTIADYWYCALSTIMNSTIV